VRPRINLSKGRETLASFLVTGGSGFLGAHFARFALQQGHAVTVFDMEPPKYAREGDRIRFAQGDICDTESLRPWVERADFVIHLAGILGTAETVVNPHPSIDVNLAAAVRLFDLLRVSNKPAVATVNGNYQWYNTYAITKEAAGRFAIMYNKEFHTKIAVLRAFNAYGEWQKDRPVRKVVPEFVRRALHNEPVEVFGSGQQQFDLVYAGDVAQALYYSVAKDHTAYDHVLEVGSGRPTTPLRLAHQIIDLTESKSKIVHLPMRPGEPEHSDLCANLDTLEPLGYRPATPEADGLPVTIEWYRQYFGQK